jgi:hypothetical protein
MSGTGLLVRQSDTIVFRQIILVLFRTSSYNSLPGEVVLNLQTGDIAAQNYPVIAVRRLVGSRADVDWTEAQDSGLNPMATYGLDSPLFIRGSDAGAGKNQAGTLWSPFLNAYFRCVGSGGTLSYLFEAVGELYQGGNSTRGYMGG